MTIDPVTKISTDPNAARLDELRQLYPEAFSEGKVDFDKLRAALGDFVDDSPERYSFTWAGKRDAIRLLQTPTAATLMPDRDESVNFDDTQHVFIEGDNLEVLKLLYKAYFGKVKMIYIDPPYNTGNDFVYPDNYADPLEPYLQLTGQKDAEGNLLTTNTDTSGRYHSRWLNMMYPRLLIARQLLADDGALFVSIGEDEQHNLRAMLHEIFGEENFVANMVWQKSKRGDSKLIAQIHEYVLVVAKNKAAAIASGHWRKPKDGADAVLAKYRQFVTVLNNDHDVVSEAMRSWYASLPKSDPCKKHSHYRYSDDRGLYFADNFAGPDDGRKSRPRYDIIHPVTKKVCKKPRTGWRWDEERMRKALAQSPPLIHFGPDETTVPCRKTYLADTSFEPMFSVFYRDGRSASKELQNLIGSSAMDFPKNVEVLQQLMQIIPDSEALVMDFFAGSAGFCQATLQLNAVDSGKRRCVSVQLPEPIEDKTFDTIADIGKGRIRQVIASMRAERTGTLGFHDDSDLGIRVFRLTESHFSSWQGSNEATPDALVGQMALFNDPLCDGWQPEDVVWEVAIKEGFPLHSKLTQANVASHTVYRVHDPDSEQSFHICLDDTVPDDIPRRLGITPEDLFVCRDLALTDTTAANLALVCRLKTI